MESEIDYSKNIALHEMVRNKPKDWRLGQAYFNYAYRMYPRDVDAIIGTEYDCFYNDSKIPLFLNALNKQLNGVELLESQPEAPTFSPEEIVLNAVTKTLIEKNKRYGNAALSPLGVFYKGNPTNSIAIRLDDKLSRMKNSGFPWRKNDVYDLLGYLFLYAISQDYFDVESALESACEGLPPKKFETQVNYIKNIILKYDSYNAPKDLKDCVKQIDITLSDIREAEPRSANVVSLMWLIVTYFVLSNTKDFSDLID